MSDEEGGKSKEKRWLAEHYERYKVARGDWGNLSEAV